MPLNTVIFSYRLSSFHISSLDRSLISGCRLGTELGTRNHGSLSMPSTSTNFNESNRRGLQHPADLPFQ